MTNRTFLPSRANSARFLIRSDWGTVIGLFSGFTSQASASPLAVAFLVGYAVEVFSRSSKDLSNRSLEIPQRPLQQELRQSHKEILSRVHKKSRSGERRKPLRKSRDAHTAHRRGKSASDKALRSGWQSSFAPSQSFAPIPVERLSIQLRLLSCSCSLCGGMEADSAATLSRRLSAPVSSGGMRSTHEARAYRL